MLEIKYEHNKKRKCYDFLIINHDAKKGASFYLPRSRLQNFSTEEILQIVIEHLNRSLKFLNEVRDGNVPTIEG